MIKTDNFSKMLTEKPLKLLLKLGVLSVLMALLDEISSFIDAVFMGNYFGSDAVSSMSIVLPILLFMVAFGTLLSDGATTAVSRYLGARNLKLANRYCANTVLLAVISGVVLGTVFYFLIPCALQLYDVSEGIKFYATVYLQVISLGLPIFLVLMVLARIVYIEGKNKYLMITILVQVALNIAINYFLIAVLKIGVRGAAIGTLLAELVQIVMLYRYINSNNMDMNLTLKNVNFGRRYFAEIMGLGLPVFVSMILLSLTMGVESRVIADFGSAALSVQTITGYAFSVSSSVASGLMSVAVVILSYSVGAKNTARFFEILRISLLVVFISVSAINLLLIINSSVVARIFTNSPYVVGLIKLPALVYGLTAPFIFTTNVVLYAMQPVGMENISTVLFALQQIVMFIPLLFFLKGFGFVYAISAQPLSEVIGGVATIFLVPMFIKKTKGYFKQQQTQSILPEAK